MTVCKVLVGVLTLQFSKLHPQASQKDAASWCSLKVKSTLLVLTVATCGAIRAWQASRDTYKTLIRHL
eukprot:710222-Pelagomonas_calceolata.AAC.1